MQHPNQEGTLAAGGATQPGQDGQFDHMAPWESLGPTEYDAPDGSWESRALRQATVVVTMPRNQVQRLVQPPLPQIAPKGVRHLNPPTVEGIFDRYARLYPDNRTSFSGSSAGWQGSSRYTYGSDFG